MVKYTRPASEAVRQGILAYYRARPNIPPTFREIADALSTSERPVLLNTVRHHVNVLIAEGLLVRAGGPGKARNIRPATLPIVQVAP